MKKKQQQRRLGDAPSTRRPTFAKRRTRLFREAHELSVLCDAQVAVMVFSSTGQVSEFASPSMTKVLEKYLESIDEKAQGEEHLQMLSHLLGKDVAGCNVQDLEILESGLCATMKKIKEMKIRCFQEYTQEMCAKVTKVESKKRRSESSDLSRQGGTPGLDMARKLFEMDNFNAFLELRLKANTQNSATSACSGITPATDGTNGQE